MRHPSSPALSAVIAAIAFVLLAMPASASTTHTLATERSVVVQAECKDFVFKAPKRFDPHENYVGCKGTLYMQNDGNLVIYDEFDKPLWATNTISPGAIGLFREDGNLVIYDTRGFPLWSSRTSAPGGRLVYTAAGNLEIRNSSGGVVWQTGTGH